MKIAGALLVFVWELGLQPCCAFARTAPTVDGVHLGMTSKDVVQALTASKQPPRVRLKYPCLAEYIAQNRNAKSLKGPGSCVQLLSARYAGGELLVFFTEDLPRRPGVSIVTTIAVNYPTDDAALAAVVQAAGPPTLTDGGAPWTVAMWCFDFSCQDMNHVLADPRSGQMLLVHRGSGLTLSDARTRSECEDAASKILEAQGVTPRPRYGMLSVNPNGAIVERIRLRKPIVGQQGVIDSVVRVKNVPGAPNVVLYLPCDARGWCQSQPIPGARRLVVIQTGDVIVVSNTTPDTTTMSSWTPPPDEGI